jgi:hypothetical protein
MSAPASSTSLAVAARAAVLELLADDGIEATGDAGAFFPQPVAVLVGLPTLDHRGLRSATFTVPVSVVSGDPLNEERAVDRLYAFADDVARSLRSDEYRPGSFSGSPNAEPLPAVEMLATVQIADTNGGT